MPIILLRSDDVICLPVNTTDQSEKKNILIQHSDFPIAMLRVTVVNLWFVVRMWIGFMLLRIRPSDVFL